MKNTAEKPKRSFLIFSTRSYPTFGRKRLPFDELNPPKTVTDSPYYWWFMFLRLNADYKATCDANGKGKCSAIYKDFGNVHTLNFKEWWTDRAHLFAEPKKGYKMKIASDINDIAPFNDKEVLNLVVPLTWSQRSLKKGFSQLVLKLIEKGKRGVSVIESEATYKLSSRWNIEAFKNAYNIYVEKQKSLNEKKKVAWADIAIRANIPYAKREKITEGVKNRHTVDIRATSTVLADRHYKRASKFIKFSASHSFPK
jgi:hypothetical protein